jgi:thiamine biosynthesis lipoprotein
MNRLFESALLFLLLLASTGCQPALHRYEFNEPKMGAGFRIALYAPDQAAADRAARTAYDRVDQLNVILSDYDPNSEISRLSQMTLDGPMAAPVPASEELFHVLSASQDVAEKTGGAFDVTIGPYGRLWKRSRDLGQLPTTRRIEEARASVGNQLMKLDPQHSTVRLLAPRMRLDVAGIAVGYVVDETLKALRDAGVDRALIDAGGDLGMSGPPPGKRGWRVGIQSLNAPQEMTGEYVELANAAISTSGDTYRFVEIDGKRYSHILDPRTGLGLTDRIGVTAIAPDGITADWIDTAVAVMGRERGSALVESVPGAAARVTTIDADGGIKVSETSRFRQFVVPPSRGGKHNPFAFVRTKDTAD